MNKKAFTLIELLVVVLIIVILAAIALPKYQVARDRAHLSGVMAIGKNVNDALDRRSLVSESTDYEALDVLDISFKDYQGNDCTSGSCRIKVSGKDYNLYTILNYSSTLGNNLTGLYSYTNSAFAILNVYTEISALLRNSGYTYKLTCYSVGGSYISSDDLDEDRCVRLGKSMGATCGSSGNIICQW